MSIIIILSCCYLFFVIPSSAGQDMDSDTLSQGDELRDPRFLTSANKIFSLQFFSPGTSKNRYVGIFYQSLDTRHTDCHPVWVANRNNPLPDASGILMITDSVLTISYSGGDPIVLTSNFGIINASATLLNDGNLVFREVNPDGSINRTLWQSFDFPTDTILPGMKLGINFRTGHKWSLTSWVSDDVPASGSLTLSGDPNGSSQLIMWWQRNPYWISGLWQYGRFDNSPWLTNVYGLDYSYISNENESYLTYSVDYHEKIVKLSINTTGWISVTGVAGVTDFNLCPFSATSTAGCVNWMLPECRNSKHQFIGSRGFAYGHSYTFNKNYNMSIFDCGLECEHNCSCIAYASIFENGTGCKIWTNDTTFTFSETLIGENVYIFQTENASVSIIHTGRDTAKKGWILPVASAGGALLVLSFLLFCILRRFRTKAAEEVLLHTIRTREKCSTADDIENDMSQVHLFRFESIEIATNNFSASNKLGEGGFGPVYKGQLPRGQDVAIKRLSRSSGQGLVEFENEILLIAKLQHNNLVKILGCCIQGQEKILVYEYMPNKSLDFFIFDPSKRELLKWIDRMNIIEGIAQGLVYLHKHSRLRVIHRDLKASNILLDQNMNPKISDFGMARIFGKQESEANTNRIVGTYGYMSPEYAMNGVVSMKTDVFSFGVLVLEIVSGKKNHRCYDPERPLNLIGFAWELWIEGRALELMDTTLERTNQENEVTRTITVGLLCVQDSAADRPSMSDVVSMLTNEYLQLPAPKQPAFLIGTNTREATKAAAVEKTCTNELSISLIEAR